MLKTCWVLPVGQRFPVKTKTSNAVEHFISDRIYLAISTQITQSKQLLFLVLVSDLRYTLPGKLSFIQVNFNEKKTF